MPGRALVQSAPRGGHQSTDRGSQIIPAMPEGARIALADDDVLLREGLASLLERSGFEVVGQAGDADELLTLVQEHEPDLVMVDIRMPRGSRPPA